MEQVQLLRVFVSSPAELHDERLLTLDVAEKLNRLRGNTEGFRVEILRWETDVIPDMNSRPQDIINQSIGDEYEVFVGILCSRFGTPTGVFGSGTEEEFRRALSRRQSGSALPRILFYFKDPRKAVESLDATELGRVQSFKKELRDLGVYCDFSSTDEYGQTLLMHLSSVVSEIRNASQPPKQEVAAVTAGSGQLAEFDDTDLGILDLTEIFEARLQSLVGFSTLLVDAQSVLSNRIERASIEMARVAEMRKMGVQNTSEAKRVLEQTSMALEHYSAQISELSPKMKESFETAMDALGSTVVIASEDGFNEADEAVDLAGIVADLRQVMINSRESLGKMAISMNSLPRMTSRLNRAKRDANKSMELILDFFDSGAKRLDVVEAQLRAYAMLVKQV